MAKTTYNSPIKGDTFLADKSNVEAVKTASKNDDTVISKEEFFASLERGEQAYRDGKCIRQLPGETVEQLLERVRG